MRIAVCDDEVIALKQTSNTVKKILDEMNLRYTISEFTNETELIDSQKKYDVVFLDIEFQNSFRNGVEVAKLLKYNNPNCIIIFITNYEEYIDEAIEKYAFRYWSKPIDEYRLRKSVKSIVERMKNITFEEYASRRQIEIAIHNIIYITTEGRYCRIVTINGEYMAAESFKEFRDKLNTKTLCSCHGSYCINLNYVEKYTKSEVYLCYGKKRYKVHISRRKYAEFKEQMFIAGGENI